MYSFTDFQTVSALPNIVTVADLSMAIGLSRPRIYSYLDEERIPYIMLNSKRVMFKEHLLQGLSGKRIYTDVAKLEVIKPLPNVFSPRELMSVFGISHGLAYELTRNIDFPAVITRNRIIVSKQGLIGWIRKNEKYTRKE